jgi:hypothetical protein
LTVAHLSLRPISPIFTLNEERIKLDLKSYVFNSFRGHLCFGVVVIPARNEVGPMAMNMNNRTHTFTFTHKIVRNHTKILWLSHKSH